MVDVWHGPKNTSGVMLNVSLKKLPKHFFRCNEKRLEILTKNNTNSMTGIEILPENCFWFLLFCLA